jgi:hypothetical protein
MKRAIMVATALAVVAIGGAAFWAVAGGKGSGSCDPAVCETEAKTVPSAKATGKILGRFDLAMAGCRFACDTKAKYDAKSVIAQPGARDGKLTQCPVSGVVLSIDATRPHVQVGEDDYVTCCETCADKLRKNHRRFVRS